MKLTATVRNLPADLDRFGWVVAKVWDGELWFYGAWFIGQEAEAKAQARAEGGVALKVE